MLDKKDRIFLSFLRKDARVNLTTVSRKTSIPISTLYDRLKQGESEYIVKHTTLLDFAKLGYSCRAHIIVKTERDLRESLRNYLSRCPFVNSLFKINNGFDFLFDAIFQNVKEMEEFVELLETKFSIANKQVYYIIEEIMRENFLTEPGVMVSGDRD
ncbi:MAG: Lrp/AsnC family transcriptional regulator [Nanoarchaeota archaeon]